MVLSKFTLFLVFLPEVGVLDLFLSYVIKCDTSSTSNSAKKDCYPQFGLSELLILRKSPSATLWPYKIQTTTGTTMISTKMTKLILCVIWHWHSKRMFSWICTWSKISSYSTEFFGGFFLVDTLVNMLCIADFLHDTWSRKNMSCIQGTLV